MAQQHQKRCNDRHTVGPEYRVVDSVLRFRPRPFIIAATEFHRPWLGQYTIVYRPSANTFVLRGPQRPTAEVVIIHYNHIKPAPCRVLTPSLSLSLVLLIPSPVAQMAEITTLNPLE
ncbi:unnamed protein product [Schistocephalus solidus]|uniref:Uncharacterized protein n=1 Tax=Schistocephalus solidus TaxID=70667 RepID=A0A183SB49_SCHSO|nr:unnamed protein product [Schistocephalus solidus]